MVSHFILLVSLIIALILRLGYNNSIMFGIFCWVILFPKTPMSFISFHLMWEFFTRVALTLFGYLFVINIQPLQVIYYTPVI